MNGTPEDWRRVWAAIDTRRRAVPLSWTQLQQRSVSETTYRKMAEGVGVVRADKRVLICRALGWTDDSIDRLLSGREPETVTAGVSDAEAALAAMQRAVASLEARVAQLEQPDPPPTSEDGGSGHGAPSTLRL